LSKVFIRDSAQEGFIPLNILVTGASGYIGGQLIPRLQALGHHVVCMVRNPQQFRDKKWESVEIRQGDVLDRASLGSAMQGIEVAYYLIHAMAGGARGFEEREYLGAENFSIAAQEMGIQRIIYLGGLGECEKDLSPHLWSRQHVGEILRDSEVPVTEFRAAVVIGLGSISFEMFRYLTERLPIMVTPKWVTTRCQPIAIENVLDYLTLCLTQSQSIGKIYEIGGPDVVTYGEMMREYASARHLKRYLVPVPILTPRLSSYWVNIVTPIPRSYAQPLIEGLRSEVVVHDPSAQEDFNIKLIPYREALHQALTRDGSGEVETYWAGAQAGLTAGRTHKITQGMFIEQHRLETDIEPKEIYDIFSRIGGKQGWYYADWLWKIRFGLDKLAGGVGRRRDQRRVGETQPGDIVDGFIVEMVESNRLIRLRNEMKAPGPAWMQFEIQRSGANRTLFIQTAFFEPHGLMGLVYWYGLYPFHQLIFSGMARAIVHRAETQKSDGRRRMNPR
jgi:uncharacterized protein YbjT (DUF2867 family)